MAAMARVGDSEMLHGAHSHLSVVLVGVDHFAVVNAGEATFDAHQATFYVIREKFHVT